MPSPRSPLLSPLLLGGLLVGLGALAAIAPADRLQAPRPETCLSLDAEPAEGEAIGSRGLSYEQIVPALNRVIQTALYCPRPEGRAELHLTFELVVGCDGLVQQVECSDDDGAPSAYVSCVTSVLARSDFPAHDMPDGMPLTYPVNVSW